MASGSAGLPGHRRRTRGETAPGLAHSSSKAGLALLDSLTLLMERESGGTERRHTVLVVEGPDKGEGDNRSERG